MRDSHWQRESESRLLWLPELGVGWYPVSDTPYDEAYWDKYRGYDRTPVGAALTRARIDFVDRHWSGRVIDIGIGGGRFVDERPGTVGFDINPRAVQWLGQRYADPYQCRLPAATFWDSLEHIHDPAPLLANITHRVFVSLPIFGGPDHVLRSKHFRRDEHCWYFTRAGFVGFMQRLGWSLLEAGTMEQAWREDIETFAFGRDVGG